MSLSAALHALSLGFPVLPVNPATKVPYIKDWNNKSAVDELSVELMWKQFPSAMVGVRTGLKGSYFVLDIDVKDGRNAVEILGELEMKYGKFSPWMTVQTPSGGLHLYFSTPQSVQLANSAGKVAKGVDIRAEGGFAVFPGSIRADGGHYKLLQGGQHA